jgi:hypothetical protein
MKNHTIATYCVQLIATVASCVLPISSSFGHSLMVETKAQLSYSLLSGGSGASSVHSSSDTSVTNAGASITAEISGVAMESRGRASYRSIGAESSLSGFYTLQQSIDGLATWYEGPMVYAISTAVDEFTISSPGSTTGIMTLNMLLEGSLSRFLSAKPELRISATAHQDGQTIMSMMQIYTDLDGIVNKTVQTPAFSFLMGSPITIEWSLNSNCQLPTNKFTQTSAYGSASSSFYGTATLSSVSVRDADGIALPWSATSASGTDYTVTVIPEASTSLLGCCVIALVLRRRRTTDG